MRRRSKAANRGQSGRRMGKKFLVFGGIVVLLLVIGAIAGGGSEDDGDPEPTPTTVAQAAPTQAPEPTVAATVEPPTDAPTEEPVADSRCEPVDDALVTALGEGLTVEGGSLRHAQAVKSSDYEEVWFVAADIQADGLEGSDDIGIWATNSLTMGEGIVYSVDEVAKEFSDWGDGGQTDAQLSANDDGAQEARGCVQAARE